MLKVTSKSHLKVWSKETFWDSVSRVHMRPYGTKMISGNKALDIVHLHTTVIFTLVPKSILTVSGEVCCMDIIGDLIVIVPILPADDRDTALLDAIQIWI